MTMHQFYTIIGKIRGIHRVPENTTAHNMIYDLNRRYVESDLQAVKYGDDYIKIVCRCCGK